MYRISQDNGIQSFQTWQRARFVPHMAILSAWTIYAGLYVSVIVVPISLFLSFRIFRSRFEVLDSGVVRLHGVISTRSIPVVDVVSVGVDPEEISVAYSRVRVRTRDNEYLVTSCITTKFPLRSRHREKKELFLEELSESVFLLKRTLGNST